MWQCLNFPEEEKKIACDVWKTWKGYDDITTMLLGLSICAEHACNDNIAELKCFTMAAQAAYPILAKSG